MDASASAAVLTGLNLFKTDSLHMFALVIPIAAVVIITVGVATFAVRTFMKMTGFSHSEIPVSDEIPMHTLYTGRQVPESEYQDAFDMGLDEFDIEEVYSHHDHDHDGT